jgi:membrane protein
VNGGIARRLDAARGWGERQWEVTRRTTTGRLIERIVRDLVEIEPFDRAMTLAAQAFTSIVPLMLVAAALRPGEQGFGQTVSESLGLPDEARAALAGAVPDESTVLSTVGILGLLVTLVSATSFSRAMERIYLRVWHVRRPGLRSAWRWLATVVAVALAAVIIGFTRQVVDAQWAGLVQLVLQVVVWTAVWTFVPWVLLRGQVPTRPLAWTALLTGVGVAVLGRIGAVYLPLALASGARQFGVLGLVFAYLGWLFALSLVVIGAAAVGHACAVDDGPVGRWVRGRDRWQEVTA